MALNNLSLCLSDVGRPEEALEAVQHAVDLYRPLRKITQQPSMPISPQLSTIFRFVSPILVVEVKLWKQFSRQLTFTNIWQLIV
jgi:hypothetical protein